MCVYVRLSSYIQTQTITYINPVAPNPASLALQREPLKMPHSRSFPASLRSDKSMFSFLYFLSKPQIYVLLPPFPPETPHQKIENARPFRRWAPTLKQPAALRSPTSATLVTESSRREVREEGMLPERHFVGSGSSSGTVLISTPGVRARAKRHSVLAQMTECTPA